MIRSVGAHSTRSVGVLRRSSSRLWPLKSPAAAVVVSCARAGAAKAQISSLWNRRRGISSPSSSSLISSTAAAFPRPLKRSILSRSKGKKNTMAPPRASSTSNNSSSPGRPLKLPPVPWIAGVAFGLGWLTLLAVAPSSLPAGMRDFALGVLSVAGLGTVEGAKSVAAVAWGIHVLEGAYAAKLVRDAGGDAGACAWWGGWAFLVGFPAVLMAKESVGEGSGSKED